MAKKGKKVGVSVITSIICLVLSLLMIATFFMPTFVDGNDDNKVAYNGVTLTQAAFMSEEDCEEALANSLNIVKYNEEEREEFGRLVAAYTYANNEDNGGFKAAAILNIAVLIVGAVGAVFSVISLLKKKTNLGLIIATLVGVVAAIALTIVSTGFVSFVYEEALIKDLVTLTTGAGVWIALVGAVLACASAVAGKVAKK